MCDVFHKPETPTFTLDELKSKPAYAAIFFNFLTNLEKLLAFERKDPFSAAGEKNDYPDYTDWDKFAMYEYKRLSSEEDDGDGVFFLFVKTNRMNFWRGMTCLIQMVIQIRRMLVLVRTGQMVVKTTKGLRI